MFKLQWFILDFVYSLIFLINFISISLIPQHINIYVYLQLIYKNTTNTHTKICKKKFAFSNLSYLILIFKKKWYIAKTLMILDFKKTFLIVGSWEYMRCVHK